VLLSFAMSFDGLSAPLERLDELVASGFDGAPLLVGIALAALLGLRHASDPDHLVAVTSLVAARRGDVRAAVRLGAWWGLGHAGTILVIGVPLIALQSDLPTWLESAAEQAIGVVILLLAVRVLWRWARGGYGATPHRHPPDPPHRHLHRGAHEHAERGPAQAAAVGMLHGLAGTGAVVLLLVAAMPTRAGALVALAVFAPMSVVSMAGCTGAFAWLLTRPAVDPLFRRVLMPALGGFGVLFGAWYAGFV
jgi:hypothetical protein